MKKLYKKVKNNQGFTLVEIAIVLLVFGLIIGGIMGPLQVQQENMDRKESKKNIELIKEAMVGYAIINGSLPCPSNRALADTSPSAGVANCSQTRGFVPWVTLGIGRYDAWGRHFTYRISPTFKTAFILTDTGDITVRDAATSGNLVVGNVPAIIVSHGKNWAGTADAEELENSDNDPNYVDKDYSSINGSGFDDLVDWVNLNTLMGKMVSAGKLP
ncbi:MAG: prepilin-type cleavage/methylation domain-containing protein [Piscirickettsiaceae bacterium]|nr:MAG: prepilin-type cleavage/methylation domain-containing protein [Piscirickettsiaceae bacterium]